MLKQIVTELRENKKIVWYFHGEKRMKGVKIKLQYKAIRCKDWVKFLEITVDKHLTWAQHVIHCKKKVLMLIKYLPS